MKEGSLQLDSRCSMHFSRNESVQDVSSKSQVQCNDTVQQKAMQLKTIQKYRTVSSTRWSFFRDPISLTFWIQKFPPAWHRHHHHLARHGHQHHHHLGRQRHCQFSTALWSNLRLNKCTPNTNTGESLINLVWFELKAKMHSVAILPVLLLLLMWWDCLLLRIACNGRRGDGT